MSLGWLIVLFWTAYVVITLVGVGHTLFNWKVLGIGDRAESKPAVRMLDVEAYARTVPYHPVYNLILWPIAAFIYLVHVARTDLWSAALMLAVVWTGATVVVTGGCRWLCTQAVRLAWVAVTRVHSGYDLVAGWLAVSGCGLGFAAPATTGAALGALSAEHAGVGSAVLQAVRQVGGTLGIAILGAVLDSTYPGQIAAAKLPQPLAAVAKQSVTAAVQLAGRMHSNSMLVAVRTAFMHSMDSVTWVGAGIAVLCIAFTLLFLPKDPVAHPEG